jgi:hypothetical protein
MLMQNERLMVDSHSPLVEYMMIDALHLKLERPVERRFPSVLSLLRVDVQLFVGIAGRNEAESGSSYQILIHKPQQVYSHDKYTSVEDILHLFIPFELNQEDAPVQILRKELDFKVE